ncbi:CRISPR-associated endonuclease Cas1 [Salisaeta longa]|uniref:CRISPR-associated endonuclease Cas1 n=1 Tax=Salisaeta longa TaxID=503170 RepID=UPI0003B4803C|nr:CRISPR-associated endonuclease Cas1 [Salisaeta longa]
MSHAPASLAPTPSPTRSRTAANSTVRPSKGIRRTLYVDTAGAVVRKRSQHFIVDVHTAEGTEQIAQVPIPEIDALALVGRVHCTMPALRLSLQRGIRVVLLSRYGKVKGYLTTPQAGHVSLRLAQYNVQQNDAQRLHLARAFVGAKLHNMAHRLKRRHRKAPSAALDAAVRSIHSFQRRLGAATTDDELRGMEGAATRAYFSVWPDLLQSDDPAFCFTKRTRRPPKDAVNALLGFTYSLLQNDVASACSIAGLDAQLGLLHRPRPYTPAAVLDLMEAFRPAVADSVVLALINRGTVRANHFHPKNGGIYLTGLGRKAVYKAYGRRRAQSVTLPGMKQALPYHRAFEAQARRLARVLEDPSIRYRAFRLR